MYLTDFLKIVLKNQFIIYTKKKNIFMDPNNLNINKIPLNENEYSNNSLRSSGKSETKINIGTEDDNITTNKNEEKKN